MTAINIPYLVPNPIHTHRWCDNGNIPSFHLYSLMAMHLNKTARWQPKCHFRSPGSLDLAAKGGTRQRWLFASHTSLFCRRLRVRMTAALSGGSSAPKVKAEVDGGNSVEFAFGAFAGTPTDAINEWGHFEGFITIAADTAFTFKFSDVTEGRLVSASVTEDTLLPDTANGYAVQDYVLNRAIYDDDRETLAQLAYDLWRLGANPIFHWSADASVFTRTSATDINIVDGTSTTITANTPGLTLDDRYMDLAAGGGTFPCILKANGLTAGGGTSHVYLKDSTGAVIATVNLNAGTQQWFSSGTFQMPATKAKFDVHADSDGANQMSLYAVSLYPKG